MQMLVTKSSFMRVVKNQTLISLIYLNLFVTNSFDFIFIFEHFILFNYMHSNIGKFTKTYLKSHFSTS